MIDDMRMRKLNGKTQIDRIRAVCSFQLHMVDTGTSPATINCTLGGLKFSSTSRSGVAN